MGDLYSFSTGEKIVSAEIGHVDPVAAAYCEKVESVTIADIKADTQNSSSEADAAMALHLAQLFGKARSSQTQ